MSLEHGFSHRFRRWLERHGLAEGDPFAIYEADQEQPHLHEFFVDRPYLHDVFGDPARPQAAFLMAGRGEGKTATREMVAYECAHGRLERRALAVNHNDFSSLLEQVHGELSRITAHLHVHAIARSTLRVLADEVPPLYFDHLDENGRALLMSYATAFADGVSLLKLTEILNSKPAPLDFGRLSAREMLVTLADLVTHLGRTDKVRYRALYVLVDRVDETMAGPQAAVPLLRSLVSDGPLLEATHVAFKFFLPKEVGDGLRQHLVLRPDRICIRTITWDQKALENMVCQRLTYYSGGVVARLEDLCEPAIKGGIMERLIRAAEGAPRSLLRLCGALLRDHVTRTDEMLITRSDLTETLYDFAQQLQVERLDAPQLLTLAERSVEPMSPPEVGLHLDSRGHVWIDGARLTPPLPPLEFRLLEILHKQAPEVVSSEELIQAVWHTAEPWQAESKTHQADEQNLRKLIARVRARLAASTGGSQSRFLRNVHGRGYWLDLR